MPVAALIPLASKGSFLISTNVGIMVWTIVVFAVSLFILRRAVFPQIGKALDDRAKTIEREIDSATLAREEADEIVQRARQSADVHEKESKERGRETVAEATKRAQREIEVATKRALDDLRREVADLTIMATEMVTRKTLDEADQRRLVEEALRELDFSGISSGAHDN